eukprot:gene6103-biopygen22311
MRDVDDLITAEHARQHNIVCAVVSLWLPVHDDVDHVGVEHKPVTLEDDVLQMLGPDGMGWVVVSWGVAAENHVKKRGTEYLL